MNYWVTRYLSQIATLTQRSQTLEQQLKRATTSASTLQAQIRALQDEIDALKHQAALDAMDHTILHSHIDTLIEPSIPKVHFVLFLFSLCCSLTLLSSLSRCLSHKHTTSGVHMHLRTRARVLSLSLSLSLSLLTLSLSPYAVSLSIISPQNTHP